MSSTSGKKEGTSTGSPAQAAEELSRLLNSLASQIGGSSGAQAASAAPARAAAGSDPLPVHFFTIVLNGEPFIRHHIEVFKQLPFNWHWHIVEGVAELTHCTAWSVKNGGRISPLLHAQGRSNDGTSAYLDELQKEYPLQVSVYRQPPDTFWQGKIAMVSAPLQALKQECLLWEVDADELWLPQQIIKMRAMFLAHPEKTAARYYCHFFIGPELAVITRGAYGNNPGEWLRTWRFKPGYFWASHEPPSLCLNNERGEKQDVAALNPFTNAETEAAGLVFQHFAYTTPQQLRFKEIYYGYANALNRWQEMQRARTFPLGLANYLPWVCDPAAASHVRKLRLPPVARKNILGSWRFTQKAPEAGEPREILYVRSDAIGDNVISSGVLQALRARYPDSGITVLCREHIAEYYEACPLVDHIITFNDTLARHDEHHRNRVISEIAERNPDLVLNPVYSPCVYNHLFSLSAKDAFSLGFRGNCANIPPQEQRLFEGQYRGLVDTAATANEVQHNRDFLKALGLEPAVYETFFWTTPEDEKAIDELLQSTKFAPERSIALFGGAQEPIKSSVNLGRSIAALCAEKNFSVIALGAAKDFEINQINCEHSRAPFLNLSGKLTLRQSAALLRRCRAALGVDTSLAHIACALKVPHVVVIGGGQFGRFLPYSPCTSVVALPLECYHCNWYCKYSIPVCLTDIFAQSIDLAFRATLQGPSGKPRLFLQNAAPPRGGAVYPRILSAHEVASNLDVQIIACETVNRAYA